MSLPGEMAEQVAAEFLSGRGLKLIERNYRCRFGEIDLIMRHGPTLVFIEVRYRRNDSFGGAAESITSAKTREAPADSASLHGIAAGVSGLPLRRRVARWRREGNHAGSRTRSASRRLRANVCAIIAPSNCQRPAET